MEATAVGRQLTVNDLRLWGYGFRTSSPDRQREGQLGLVVLASLHTVIRVEIQLPQHLTRIDILPKLLPVNSISSLMPATTWVVTIDLDLDKHVICLPWHFCSSPRLGTTDHSLSGNCPVPRGGHCRTGS